MLCLLSQNALDSKWIPWEVGYGYDRTTVVGLTLKANLEILLGLTKTN